MATVSALYRYPVKGLSPEALDRVELRAGQTMPFDRAYAIENGPSPFDPRAPATIQKAYFLMLMKNERLAALKTRFTDADHRLTIRHEGAVVAEGRLDTAAGRAAIEAYFDRAFAGELRGPARILSAPGLSFSDTAAKVVSLINAETVAAIEGPVGSPQRESSRSDAVAPGRKKLDPLRFRGNLLVAGLPAWAEFDWVGRKIAAGGAVLEARKRIDRCAATNVDPATGVRDLRIPDALRAAYGHIDCGIYLSVVAGGTVAVGDEIAPR